MLCVMASSATFSRLPGFAGREKRWYKSRYAAIIPRRKEKCKDSLSYHVSPEKATGAHRFSLCAPACSVLPFCPALCPGEGDVGAEQVAVDGQMECTAHELHQTAGYGQAQAAALCVAGGVTPDEAFHQLIGGDVQLSAGDVLEADGHMLLVTGRHGVDPGVLQGVFADVAHQIVHDTAEQLAVGIDGDGLLRRAGYQRQAAVGQPVLVFAHDLVEQHGDVRGLQIYRQCAGGRLGRLHQILRQLLQAAALTIQHSNVLPGSFRLHVLLLQQVHVVDDGCQRSFDVMGHVGDQFSLHALSPGLLLHGLLHAGAQVVHALAVALEVADEPLGVDVLGEVAVGHVFAASLQNAEVQGNIQNDQILHQLDHQEDTAIWTVGAAHEQDRLDEEHSQRQQGGLPYQGQTDGDAVQAAARGPDDAPQQTAAPGDERASQHRPGLTLGGKGAQEQQEKRCQRRAEKDPPPLVIESIPTHVKQAQQDDQPHVGGYLVQPCQVDAVSALPMAAGGHKEAEAKQRQHRKKHGEKDGQAGVLQKPRAEQVGVAGGLVGLLQQGGGDGDGVIERVCSAVHQVIGVGALCGIEDLFAACKIEVGEPHLAAVGVKDVELTGGGLPGKLLGEQPGQVVQQPLGGLRVVGDGGDGGVHAIGVVVRVIHQAHAVQLAAEEAVGRVDGAVALLLIQPLTEGLALVQEYIVVGQNADAQAAQNGGQAEKQRQEKGGQLGPGRVQPCFHVSRPSIL